MAGETVGLNETGRSPGPNDWDIFRTRTHALRQAIEKDLFDGNLPFCVVGSPATVNTGAVDDLSAIDDICQEHDLWFHVDGAFGAVAALSDKLKPLFKGLDRADSIAFDFQEWMHKQCGAGCVLIRRADIHRDSFTPWRDYLTAAPRGHAAGNPWFCEYGPELSRGFRAQRVWFHLREHGLQRILEKVEDSCCQAKYLGELVKAQLDLELTTPVSLNICCFRYFVPGLTDTALNRLNENIVMNLQESGVAALSTARLSGKLAIQVNTTNHRASKADFDLLIDEVIKLGGKLKP